MTGQHPSDPGTPTAEQQERFKWAANERADRAEAQRDRLRAALAAYLEADDLAHWPSALADAQTWGAFMEAWWKSKRELRAALTDDSGPKP